MFDPEPEGRPAKRPSLVENWISLFGIVIAACSFFAVLCLISIDLIAGYGNPYMGILTYIVAPGFLVAGLVLVAGGAFWEWRRRHYLAPGEFPRHPRIDFNIPRHRRAFFSVTTVSFVFLLFTAFGSYRTYHFTESVQFCGTTCHNLMKPEYTAYKNSPHARVACVECHIGPGADWFVRSKLSGSYQVYATLANKYPRPIPTPIKNLRPAQETCEQCHWPQKFYGSAERVNYHYLADETNTPWTVSLLMKIGGGDPTRGLAGGIHWHMNINNKVEYIAADPERQKIPWIRVTGHDGKVTVYESTENKLTPQEIGAATPRRMDCIDCHNRPSHVYNPPNKSVNLAMATGRIDVRIPFIKKLAVETLTKDYATTPAAMTGMVEMMNNFYRTNAVEFARQHPELIQQAISEVQNIYCQNFFPEMNVNWRKYPNNIGHTIFPGCYRCHDGKHASAEGKPISHDCTSCHTILYQGAGTMPAQIGPNGLEFQHPVDIGELWKDMNCAECHNGALVQQ